MPERRWIRWIAPLLILPALFAGCGGDSNPQPADSTADTAPASSTDSPPGSQDAPGPDGDDAAAATTETASDASHTPAARTAKLDFTSMLFVFMLATFIGIGVIRRVSRLLHTPLMSLTNAISAIAVVGSLIIAGSEHYSGGYRFFGALALAASMTNIVSGFLITDRMLKMFKTREGGK